jgi:hypothetical protein
MFYNLPDFPYEYHPLLLGMSPFNPTIVIKGYTIAWFGHEYCIVNGSLQDLLVA